VTSVANYNSRYETTFVRKGSNITNIISEISTLEDFSKRDLSSANARKDYGSDSRNAGECGNPQREEFSRIGGNPKRYLFMSILTAAIGIL